MPKHNTLKKSSADGVPTLPSQEKFFATSGLKRSVRAGTQLPDPTQAPYGYDPTAQFKHLFPALELPILKPPASHHLEDRVSFGSPGLLPHELYLGDNLYLLRQLPSESVDLIYIDPPFFSNRTYTQIWGDDNEVRSFDDIFADGMFSYLAWLNARLWEMKRVLKSTGSIYVHCDWHASHYLKTELDKIFGYDNCVNEIVWSYGARASQATRWFQRKHDVIFWYSKGSTFKYNPVKLPYDQDKSTMYKEVDAEGRPWRWQTRKSQDGTRSRVKTYLQGWKNATDVWEIPIINGPSAERIGYPTQKPIELLQRIIEASSDAGDTVADFFMGGGTTGAVALGQRLVRETADKSKIVNQSELQRRFIGCDISRVATSVSASRLVDIAEEISGVVVSSNKEKTLGITLRPVADIQIGYVGSYPIDKFKGIAQQEFIDFVCRLYGANVFTGKAKYIHGLANGKLIISVGPADPDAKVPLTQVEGFVEEVVRQYAQQLKEGEERVLQVVGWGFDPAIEAWKGRAINALNAQGVKMQIELISLSSESFRQKIFRQIGEANVDLKFNRLNRLLSFSASPYAGRIVVDGQDKLTFKLRLDGAKAIGTGRLINCQWDFSYDGSRFASREHALNREGAQGHFEAKLDIEHTFGQAGEYTIAARVQDNLDGEAIATLRLKIANGSVKEMP